MNLSIKHYLDLLLNEAGMQYDEAELANDMEALEKLADRVEALESAKANDVEPVAVTSAHSDSIPFWQGCHSVEDAVDPLKVQLEQPPARNVDYCSPTWVICWDNGSDEESTIILVHRELTALAALLLRVAASYENSRDEDHA